ncbi:hypothetical protein MMC31_005134 [Peltigera leucophlebia]|nr:hypothetical protein [Peltigera leucophlebia]
MSKKVQKDTQMSKIIKILKNRVENILDAEVSWLEFMSNVDGREHEDARKRYWRVNPNLMEDPPALDDVQKLPLLRRRMHQIMKYADFQKQTGEIARRLVASSFYLEISTSSPQDFETFFCAEIQCKFPSASQELRHLGEYFKNMTTLNFQPYFIIEEKGSTSEPIKVIITQQLIQGMMMNASFDIGPVSIPISTESAISTISLSIVDGEELSISGFPRALLAKKVVKELSPSSDKHGEQIKPGRASWHETFVGDGTSSYTGESSNTAFPELQRLPKRAKLPIWRFLREQLSNCKGGKEIPRRMWLLAEAVKEQDNDEDRNGEKEDPEAEGAGWPYSTILHTACLVGNHWLVGLQIEAGVDVSALDEHSWTALMVATAQGHASCANLLSKHMETGNVKAAPQPLPPSGFCQIDSKMELFIGQAILTAVADSSICVRTSDHPIPLHFQTFYYEVKVLSSGWNVFMDMGLLGPGKPGFGLPGWNPFYLTCYSYGKGDIVGCGINTQTGKIFFTKNGVDLGVAYANVKGILFPVLRFGDRSGIEVNFGKREFVYDIEAHDWTVE